MADFNNGNITGDVKVFGKILGTIYARSNSYLNPLLCSNADRADDSTGATKTGSWTVVNSEWELFNLKSYIQKIVIETIVAFT